MTTLASARRRICVVTSTRAEYGQLCPLLRRLQSDDGVALQLVVTGAHLSPEFGNTYQEIEGDGFRIDERIEILLSGDTPGSVSKSTALGLIGFSDAFARLRPEIVVVLGDRFELLSVAAAALFHGIPLAHLYGGELTEGAMDDAIRHALTKLAHLHFTSTETYRRRILQLGEAPDRVHNVGSLAVENARNEVLLTREQLERDLGLTLAHPSFLVTFHSETLSPGVSVAHFQELLAALDGWPDARLVFTYPNADQEGRALIRQVEAYASARPDRVRAVKSLGRKRYLSLLPHVDTVIGNSSSALVEAPAFRKPSVNIGDRQRGRLKGETVIDCASDRASIQAAIRKALSPEFAGVVARARSPFGEGETSANIVRILRDTPLQGILHKTFHDGPGRDETNDREHVGVST